MTRVLLIEPDRVLAKQYWAALEKAGHEVVICLNGHQAIFAADERTPDIVILELQLKSHNGVEFLYEFRSYTDWQKVPVIVLSLVPPASFSGAAALPLLDIKKHLYKPDTKLGKLVEVVDEVLSVTKVS